MAVRICVPADMLTDLQSFAESTDGTFEFVTESPFDLKVVRDEPKARCTGDELKVGGRIACAAAWAMGRKHKVPLLTLGALLDQLQIKVRECSLGCFK